MNSLTKMMNMRRMGNHQISMTATPDQGYIPAIYVPRMLKRLPLVKQMHDLPMAQENHLVKVKEESLREHMNNLRGMSMMKMIHR